ncbi:hypothetical protein SEMRO_4203_G353371.1 [Seminavis robusta]|uniref:Uncharacterized protein n=1 Tax=Seminavis robusta TaxID=568900 RepID=A0A9N8F1G2_9STRA|nr:hypothetical protein SEMRO_4203_G353371.1 [Seminavis robusta]|eukprot:Sro4203_g353371.1  (270) ;mRNA; r:1214-2023
MHPPADDELAQLPHVILTSGAQWNPKVLDYRHSDHDDWYNRIMLESDDTAVISFDSTGSYRHRIPHPDINPEHITPIDEDPLCINRTQFLQSFRISSNLNQVYACFDANVTNTDETTVPTPSVEVAPKRIDYSQYFSFFLHVPVDKIRRTFDTTTQNAQNVMSGHHIQQTIRSPFPAHNVWRRNEPVATDTITGAIPAICCGHKYAQIFVGRKSLVVDVFGMSTSSQFVNTLEDVIRIRGAMDALISDSAALEISDRVKELLRALCIDS